LRQCSTGRPAGLLGNTAYTQQCLHNSLFCTGRLGSVLFNPQPLASHNGMCQLPSFTYFELGWRKLTGCLQAVHIGATIRRLTSPCAPSQNWRSSATAIAPNLGTSTRPALVREAICWYKSITLSETSLTAFSCCPQTVLLPRRTATARHGRLTIGIVWTTV
jgi:hypothetical protein